MYQVTLIFPKNREISEKKYAEVLDDIVAEKLHHDELGYLISDLVEKENNIKN